jgi:hypothetical protein
MTKSSICTYLRGALSCILDFDSIYILKLFVYMLLELISESSLFLVYLVDSNLLIYHLFVLSSIIKKGKIEASKPLFVFW